MVRKMPKKSTATSIMGPAVKPFACRIPAGVRQRESAARAMMAASRRGARRSATLWVAGDQDLEKMTDGLSRYAAQVQGNQAMKKAGFDSSLIVMKGTGHALNAAYKGEIRAWQYNELLLGGFRLPEETLEAFLRSVELDPGAAALVEWCESRGVPFRVLSDGFDRNLDRIQELRGLRFAYDANRLWYEGGAWRIARSKASIVSSLWMASLISTKAIILRPSLRAFTSAV